ncbi:MAG: response regulator [Halobacteriaceae archaeon]
MAGVRILHVDDDAAFCDLTATALERADEEFEVVTETSAGDALDRLERESVDCVVSDYQMPGMDGVEFLRAVRESRPDLPFVLFTGQGSEDVASEAITAGATDYLQKRPGTEQYELLANRVQNAVEQFRSERRAAALDRVRTLASDVNQALVRAESRTAVEGRVCELLADAEPYSLVAVTRVDGETGAVSVAECVGGDAARLEGAVDAAVGGEARGNADGGPPRLAGLLVGVDGGVGPGDVVQDAADTGGGDADGDAQGDTLAVRRDVDEGTGPVSALARDRGHGALAVVPLVHRSTTYGHLVAFVEESGDLDAPERDLLAELGDDLAHAISAHELRAELERSTERFRALFENAPGPALAAEIADEGHRVVDVNDAFERAFGYDEADIDGEFVDEVLVPEADRSQHREFRRRAEAGETVLAEVERQTVTGVREFLLTVVPYPSSADEPAGTFAWYTDLDERWDGSGG